jgi:hypothetical protein
MYHVAKARGLWWVIDRDGYEVSYVGYDTKAQALDAARVREDEDNQYWARKVSEQRQQFQGRH